MSEEPSDTDSVNSEIVNSVNYVNNSTSYINDNCKNESQLKHTNPMHDSRTSLTDNSYDSSQDNTDDDMVSMHHVNMVTDEMTNNKGTEIIGMTEQESDTANPLDSELNFNELTHTEKTENFVLINKQHLEGESDSQETDNTFTKQTNIAGKEAKPPKAPRFLFPSKDKMIPENLLVDKRSNIDKFKSILATIQQIYPQETYEDICSTCQRDCAIMDLDPKTNTSVCFQLYKKLIKHYKASNKLSYGETKQINNILQDIGVTTDTIQADQYTIDTENQIFNCYDIFTTQLQANCKAKNLPYIKVMINNKLTHFIIDTGASRSICLGQHANDIEQIAHKIDYDPVSISGIMTTSTKCIQYTATFPIQFPNDTSCWNLTAWVASTKVKFKFNLLGSDFLDQYDAIVNMGDKVLLLYNNNKKLEIPFTYVKTFPTQIYQLNSKTDEKNTTDTIQDSN